MQNENTLDDLSYLIEKLECELPRISYFDWNNMQKVRPCLEMLVWVLDDCGNKKLCYLDVREDKPFWVDIDRNTFSYESVQWWMPISIRYMEGVILGELLKEEHEKISKTKKENTHSETTRERLD